MASPFPSGAPQRLPDPDETADALASVSVVQSGAIIVIPDLATVSAASLQPTDHLIAWVKLKVGGKVIRVSKKTEKATRRRVLRTIHPNLNLNHVKSGRPKEEMEHLILRIDRAMALALSRADLATLSSKAFREQARRDARRVEDAKRVAVGSIRAALLGNASHLTLEELVRMWNECAVERVMSS